MRLPVVNMSLPVPAPERAVYYAGLAVLVAVKISLAAYRLEELA